MKKVKIYEKKAKTKKHKFSILPTVTLILVIAGFAYASYFSYDYAIMRQRTYTSDYEVKLDKENLIEIIIPSGASTKEIGKMLADLKIIDSLFVFQALSNINGYDGQYRSGTHYLNYDMKYEDIMIVLSSKPEIVKVTIPEGFTIKQIKDRLEENGLIEGYEFDEIVDNIRLDEFESITQDDIDNKRDVRLEGYLFPDTYEFDKNAGEEYIVTRMLSRFDFLITDEMIEDAKETGLSMDEIIILASILEKESMFFNERKKIAGVFYNRLNSDDPDMKKLQSCATVNYILAREGKEVKEIISNEEQSINDPYNTYMYQGLPIGPICCPGIDSIKAAIYPDEHDFYYFALKDDDTGRHIFSRTYREHLEIISN